MVVLKRFEKYKKKEDERKEGFKANMSTHTHRHTSDSFLARLGLSNANRFDCDMSAAVCTSLT